MPSLSVVIPTYNRRKKVECAIQSVLQQTRSPDEIIVVDDGSTDETADFIRSEFGPSVVLISQRNKGVSSARNTGIRGSRGDLIAFLDSDDIWLPEKLERQLPLMEDDRIVLSATNWKWESGDEKLGFDDFEFQSDTVTLKNPLHFLTRFEGHRILLPSWMVRKQALERVGCFDERMRVAEDNRLLHRLAFEGQFALSTKVGIIRSASIDNNNLTRPEMNTYQAEVALLSSEFYSETYIRASSGPVELQHRVGQLLAHFLRRTAQCACMDQRYRFARQKAKEVLALSPRRRDFLVAAAIIAAPRLVGRRERSKFNEQIGN